MGIDFFQNDFENTVREINTQHVNFAMSSDAETESDRSLTPEGGGGADIT